jgi:hypothetical protein
MLQLIGVKRTVKYRSPYAMRATERGLLVLSEIILCAVPNFKLTTLSSDGLCNTSRQNWLESFKIIYD